MRRLLIVLVVLAVLLGAGDVGARSLAQQMIATRIQRSEGLAQPPVVTATGFPFLLQVARGTYQQVDVGVQGVSAPAGLRIDRIDVRLLGVHVPVSTLLGSGPRTIPVDHLTVTGTVSYSALDAVAAAALNGRLSDVHVTDGGDGRLRLAAGYPVAGTTVSVSALARVTLSKGRVKVTVPAESLTMLLPAQRAAVASMLTLSAPIQRLPFGLIPTGLSAGPEGVTVSAQGTDVNLTSRPLTP